MPGRKRAAGMCGFGNLGVDHWLSLAVLFAQFFEFMFLAELFCVATVIKFVILKEIIGNTHMSSLLHSFLIF